MDRFKNIREVTSPLSHSTSPYETHQSVVITRNGVDLNPTRLDFKSTAAQVQSKFANINMIQSQVMPANTHTTTHTTTTISSNTGFGAPSRSGMFGNDSFMQGSVVGRFGASNNVGASRSIDPMKESTMSYMRAINRGINGLSEERLREISENFLRLYGTDRQLTQNGVKNIQKVAHSEAGTNFQQTEQTIKGLFHVLDENKDSRVSQEDIMAAARRYLSFDKKLIVYAPIVEERLAVARRLFKQFDVERKGYLTEQQVPNLLSETYKCLGKTFTATKEDVRSWMKLTDGDGDGHVKLPEYEQSIIRALKKQGVRIYED